MIKKDKIKVFVYKKKKKIANDQKKDKIKFYRYNEKSKSNAINS